MSPTGPIGPVEAAEVTVTEPAPSWWAEFRMSNRNIVALLLVLALIVSAFVDTAITEALSLPASFALGYLFGEK